MDIKKKITIDPMTLFNGRIQCNCANEHFPLYGNAWPIMFAMQLLPNLYHMKVKHVFGFDISK